jgi:hypothetical protein
MGEGLIGTASGKRRKDSHQQGRQKLVGNRDGGLGQTQPECGDAKDDLSKDESCNETQQRPLLTGPTTSE